MNGGREVEALAATLRRPAKALEAFARLAPEEVRALRSVIDAACERDRLRIDAALDRAIPRLLRPIARLLLGSRKA